MLGLKDSKCKCELVEAIDTRIGAKPILKGGKINE
jgi:hypothetical protein